MQTEARVGVVVEGGQRALNSGHASIVDGGARKFEQQQQQQRSLHQQSQIGTVSQLLAGGVAGAVSKTCTAPLARLTILFQVQGMHCNAATLSKASIWHEASRIVNEEGFRAFWKGNMVTIAHRLPYSSVSFYSYERYKNLLQSIPGLESHRENITADLFVRLVGGGLAGITAASATYPLDLVRTRLAAQTNVNYYRGIWHSLRTISSEEGLLGLYKATFPLDLVRRRMQLEGAGGRARVYKTGLFGTFGHIVRTEGLRGLYRGIIPEYYKVVPSVGIVFMTYETMKLLLSEKAADG